jgi:hypothetical protein
VRPLCAVNRPGGDTPIPFQSYELIGASEKVSLGVPAGCQLVEDFGSFAVFFEVLWIFLG